MCPYCHETHGRTESCRNNSARLDVLQFDVQLAAGDGAGEDRREVAGLAIPYGEELERYDWLTGATRWLFEEGSVIAPETQQLFYGHDHQLAGMPIGRVTSWEQTSAGPRAVARISQTPKGDEVYTLLRDDVLNRFSVGLDRTLARTRVEDADSDNPLLVFEEIPAWELSVVPLPAYDSAKIDAVLHRTRTTPTPKGNTMHTCSSCGAQLAEGVTDCPTCARLDGLASAEEVTALAGSVDQLSRQIATLGEAGGAGAPIDVPGQSYGEFLQLAARGDERALAFLAFVGQDTGDLVSAEWITNTWVGDLVRRLTERRRILNLFRTRPLPATGMTIEFGRVLDESGVNVGEQLAEGDLLAYGKLAFDAGATAPVRTFGGWGDMSRQVIERSGVGIVEMFFEALFTRYLQVTEAAARVLAIDPANARVAQTTAASDLTDADGWTDFIVDSAFALDDAGLPLDFLLVSRDRFKSLATLRTGPADDAPYLLSRDTGTISVTGLQGRMFNVPIEPLNVAGDYVRAGSAEAITTVEAPGAPFRLQDDDITHLTKAFSLYGYAAFASTNAQALIRPTDAGDVAP
jgi:HK97 family phage prohead protease